MRDRDCANAPHAVRSLESATRGPALAPVLPTRADDTPMKLSLCICVSIFTFALAGRELHAAAQSGQAPSGAKPATQPAPAAPDAAAKAIVRAEKPAYPLRTCAVDGAALGAAALDEVAGGHLVRLCSAACAEKLQREPAKYREFVTAAVVKQQKPTYPLTTCPATGEALETAIDHVHGTRLVRLKGAEARLAFEKAPAAALAKVDQALIAAQLPS